LTRVARRAGGGELVVLLHGAGADHRIFQAIIDVAPTRFTAFAPDLRGHGDGARGPFSLAAIVDDLLALLDELGFAHAHWVGVELGGVVAQLLAKRHPERVLSLVLASTFAHYGAAAGQRALSREPAGPRREILRALYAVDLREALDDVTVPVLVLGGEDDDVVPPAPYLHTLATGLHAPCVRVLPGLGHLGSAQHGDALAAATWAFLRTLPGPGADEGACFASPPECAGARRPRPSDKRPRCSAWRGTRWSSAKASARLPEAPRAPGGWPSAPRFPSTRGPPRRFVDLPSEHHAHHGLASAKVLHGADLVLLVGDAQMPQMEANLPHIRVGLRADAAATQSLVGDPVVTLRALATAFDALVDGPLAAQLAGRREVLAERREAARRELAAALHADADAELVTLRLLGPHPRGAAPARSFELQRIRRRPFVFRGIRVRHPLRLRARTPRRRPRFRPCEKTRAAGAHGRRARLGARPRGARGGASDRREPRARRGAPRSFARRAPERARALPRAVLGPRRRGHARVRRRAARRLVLPHTAMVTRYAAPGLHAQGAYALDPALRPRAEAVVRFVVRMTPSSEAPSGAQALAFEHKKRP
jgi:pimeloyl-ACP methyl ester carboxylesterase